MQQKRDGDRTDPEQLAPLWSLAVRVLLALGSVNLILAALTWVAGPAIHPLLSAPDAWLMFAVTAVGMIGNALVLLLLRHLLLSPVVVGHATPARAFARLPLRADLSFARHRARLRAGGRPAPRAIGERSICRD